MEGKSYELRAVSYELWATKNGIANPAAGFWWKLIAFNFEQAMKL